MKLVLKIAAGIILAIVILVIAISALVGTASDEINKEVNKQHAWSLRIDAPANAPWSGSVGSSTRDGTGPTVINFKDAYLATAAVVQKQDGGHWTLRLTLLKDGATIDSKQTSAAYGVVTVEGSDF